MLQTRSRIALIITLSLIIIVAPLALIAGQANAQNDVISEIRTRLVQKNVPVKNINIQSRTPFRLEVTIQSTSQTQLAVPNDPILEMAVHREIAAARRRGAKIDSVKVIVVNSQGQAIFWSDLPVDKAIDTTPHLFSSVDNATVATGIRDQVPLNGMIFDRLDVTQDSDGTQVVTLKLSVPDIQTANRAIPAFMPALSGVLHNLRSGQGAQIATYTVEIIDAAGQPLLTYVNDYLPSEERESWWQAPGLTQEWFPHPAPTAPVP
jgi:hypothetical protein